MQISDDGTKMTILDYINDRINQHSLSTAWDITTLSTTTSSFLSITNPDNARNIHYNGDGTKLYATTNDTTPDIVNIHSWDLSTPYDISTAGAETVNNVYSVLDQSGAGQYGNIVVLDTPQNSYVVLGSQGIPEGYVFKNGINTGSLWDSGSYEGATPYGTNANDENHIYTLERYGGAPAITWTLYQLYTNIS